MRVVAHVDTTGVGSTSLDTCCEVGGVDHVDAAGTVKAALDDEGDAVGGVGCAVGAGAGDGVGGGACCGSRRWGTFEDDIGDGSVNRCGSCHGGGDEEGDCEGLEERHVEIVCLYWSEYCVLLILRKPPGLMYCCVV